MKRTRTLIAIILMLSIAGIFIACSPTGPNTAASEKPSAASAVPSASDIAPATDSVQTIVTSSASVSADATAPAQSPSSAPSSGIQFSEVTWSNGSTTTLIYPQLLLMSDSAAQERLNKLIYGVVTRDLASLENGTEYELKSKMTFNNASVVSMYFEGYMNVPGSAHPSQFLRTLTLDVGKQRIVTLPELVRIDEAFIELMLNGKYSSMGYEMTSEYESSIKDYLLALGTDFWLSELRNADTPGHDTSSYLTEDGLVISVSVPHVMGDHIEILLSFKDLSGYQTANPLWKEIEK